MGSLSNSPEESKKEETLNNIRKMTWKRKNQKKNRRASSSESDAQVGESSNLISSAAEMNGSSESKSKHLVVPLATEVVETVETEVRKNNNDTKTREYYKEELRKYKHKFLIRESFYWNTEGKDIGLPDVPEEQFFRYIHPRDKVAAEFYTDAFRKEELSNVCKDAANAVVAPRTQLHPSSLSIESSNLNPDVPAFIPIVQENNVYVEPIVGTATVPIPFAKKSDVSVEPIPNGVTAKRRLGISLNRKRLEPALDQAPLPVYNIFAKSPDETARMTEDVDKILNHIDATRIKNLATGPSPVATVMNVEPNGKPKDIRIPLSVPTAMVQPSIYTRGTIQEDHVENAECLQKSCATPTIFSSGQTSPYSCGNDATVLPFNNLHIAVVDQNQTAISGSQSVYANYQKSGKQVQNQQTELIQTYQTPAMLFNSPQTVASHQFAEDCKQTVVSGSQSILANSETPDVGVQHWPPGLSQMYQAPVMPINCPQAVCNQFNEDQNNTTISQSQGQLKVANNQTFGVGAQNGPLRGEQVQPVLQCRPYDSTSPIMQENSCNFTSRLPPGIPLPFTQSNVSYSSTMYPMLVTQSCNNSAIEKQRSPTGIQSSIPQSNGIPVSLSYDTSTVKVNQLPTGIQSLFPSCNTNYSSSSSAMPVSQPFNNSVMEEQELPGGLKFNSSYSSSTVLLSHTYSNSIVDEQASPPMSDLTLKTIATEGRHCQQFLSRDPKMTRFPNNDLEKHSSPQQPGSFDDDSALVEWQPRFLNNRYAIPARSILKRAKFEFAEKNIGFSRSNYASKPAIKYNKKVTFIL